MAGEIWHALDSYDGRDRLISTTHSDGSPGISRTWWADGKPRTISSGGTTWTLGFNLRRLPTTETLDVAGTSYAIGWDYDVHGGLRSITYPLGGPVVALNPNALGQPKQFGTLASGVTHHPNGMLAGYTPGNGVAFSSSLNLRSLPQTLRHGNLVHDLLGYDANANISAITDAAAGTSSRTMGYDPLDRLTSVAAPGIWGLATYGYDPLDNLRSSTVGNRVNTHGYDANNRLWSISGNTGTVAYAHDPRGNVVQRGGQIFRFDLANRLSAADGLVSHIYDGLGRRVRSVQTDGTVRTYVYSQAGQLMFSASTGGPGPARSTKHGYLGGKLFVELDSVKGTEFVHTDLLGSPVARSNAGGQFVNRTLHEPYGLTAAGAAPASVGFTGHVSDASTGLVYMQQRHYDPIAGRFLSNDPVATDAKTGNSFNRYVYGNNNPYNFRDPDGRCPVAKDGIACTAVLAPGVKISDQKLVDGLNKIAAEIDKRIDVYSGDRDPGKNDKVGGAKDSAHITGNAADVRIPGLTKRETAQTIYDSSARQESGIRQVYHRPDNGKLPEHTHLDTKPGGDLQQNPGGGYTPLTVLEVKKPDEK